LLATPFRLHDIDDVEGFVAATIKRAGITADEDEMQELKLEGIAILFELERKFDPHRPGYDRPGWFSGYAAQFLPRRLGDAWHRAHPEHRYVTGPDGKRRWVYDQAPASLDAITSSKPHAGDRGDFHGNDGVMARVRRLGEFIPLPIPSGACA
jgi:hypothetical protein